MDAAVSNDNADLRPPALLRGTARGLEIHVNGLATVDEILASVTTRLEEAPAFFRGSDVRIRVDDGPLPAGCLGRLDDVALTYELRIVEVGASKKDKPLRIVDADAVPQPNLAAGSAPSPAQLEPPPLQPPELLDAHESFDEYPTAQAVNPLAALVLPPILAEATVMSEPLMLADSELTELVEVLRSEQINFDEPTQTAVPITLATSAESELEPTAGTRIVIGPVRSGVILEHHGHLIVFGDVNPGAEIRAEGNIVVLGRLRGTAHAGIGQDVGFILALRLEPQQLRVGRKVARAADSDTPPSDPEIAYLISGISGTSDQIVVERYSGKLPRNLATSI